MPSSYLSSADLLAYGLPASTTPAAITQASALVDDFLGRPEGLVWAPDAAGAPAYMAAAQPVMTFALAAAIAPGANVTAQITPPIATQDLVGDVLILDRASSGASPSLVEACLVTAVQSPGVIVLASVSQPHAIGATLDQGLLITEERALPSKRSVTRASRAPLLRILGLQGRYGFGRRSDQIGGLYQDMNLLAAAQTFGGPPLWISIDPTQASISVTTGEIWVPAGMLLAYYSEARVRYVAGYAAGTIPAPIRAATAQIAANMTSLAGLGGTATRIRAGDTEIQRTIASTVDSDTLRMLAPYRTRVLF